MTLRSFIRQYAPSSVLQFYRTTSVGLRRLFPSKWVVWYFNRKKAARFRNKNGEEVFTDIYNNSRLWGSEESVSGSGSTIANTKSLVKDLELVIKELNITSMLDIPCGDFNWMRTVQLDKVKYIGGDIVKELIKVNQEKYGQQGDFDFRVMNLLSDAIPTCDLVFIRDCFVHLSYDDIRCAIDNIIKSNSKYLMTTTFPNTSENYDIVSGGWRSLNFQIEPFNFPDPIQNIKENYKSYNGEYEDKAMAIYKIEDLKLMLSAQHSESRAS